MLMLLSAVKRKNPKEENQKMSAYEDTNPLGARTNFPEGRRLFEVDLTGLAVPVGEVVEVPIVLNMEHFSHFIVYYIIDQDVLTTVEWFNTPARGFVHEKTLLLAASSPDGALVEGRVLGRRMKLKFTNDALVNDLTQIYVAVFGRR